MLSFIVLYIVLYCIILLYFSYDNLFQKKERELIQRTESLQSKNQQLQFKWESEKLQLLSRVNILEQENTNFLSEVPEICSSLN